MSTSQFPKCLTANESNIPVPRRIQTGIRKSKRCAQLPELQKYIETIIKASNECDSEDTSQSDRDKFPRERRFARYSVFKGLDNKIKQEKIKNDLSLTRSKSNNKAKAPFSEAVSRGDKLTSSFVPEFEDPRNWKLNRTNYLGPSVEIEKFLKKFYPNPYHLETVTEFKDSKGEKDDLRDGTLPDVVISKTNIDTQVDIEKRDNDLVTAEVEIKPCKRGSKDKNLSSETSPENPNSSPPSEEKTDESSKTENLGTISAPTLIKSPPEAKDSHSASSTTSQTSSLDNIKRVFLKESQMNFKKKKNLKCKTKFKPSKTERHSDYDIGKLKLLSLSDSDEFTREKEIKPKNKQTDESDAIVNEKTLTPCEEIYKTEEFNDIKEIYDVMNKATESFLYISSKNESKEQFREETTEIRSKNLDDARNNLIKTKLEEEEEAYPVKKNLLSVLLKEDNLECRNNRKEITPECNESTDENRDTFQEQKGGACDVDDDHQKIDDVLDFMYDCLKKFNKKEIPPQQKNYSPTEKNRNVPKTTWKKVWKDDERPTTSHSSRSTSQKESTESLSGKNFPEKKDVQCKYEAALHEINKKQITRLRCKRKPEVFARNSLVFEQKIDEIPSERQVGRIVGLSQLEIQPVAYQRPVEVIEQNVSITTVVTVESQNELGGFAEDSRNLLVADTRTSKSLLPLSAKLKKSRVSTTRLKDVLEAEEKLMTKAKTPEKSQDLGQVLVVNRPSSNALSHFGGFKQSASNFVICVNSLPRDLRTVNSIKPTIPLPVSISLSDIKGSWDFKQLTIYPKFHSQKLSLPEEVRKGVLKRIYDFKQEVILTINKPVVAYTARHVCLKTVTDHSKQTEEFSLKSSECLIRVLVKAIKQSVFSESCVLRESVKTFTLPSERIKIEEKPVKALIEAIEEAEEKVFLLEQSTESGENLYCRNSELCSLSASETLRNEFSETDNEKEGDKKKVHELLLRTYNLQQKLQKCLQKITCVEPTTLPSSEERVFDILVRNEIKAELDIKPEYSLPLVHWHLKSPGVESTTKGSTEVDSPTADHGTSYDPPKDVTYEEKEKCESPPTPEKPDDDDDDDRSSNYSFKSSNDFSEGSETPKDHVNKRRFIKKIFNEIESYRQSYESEKRQNEEPNPEPPTGIPENRLTHFDPKTSAKVLKTVFKGKRSSTELTIGLKDVPMTKVGNISVEKTKFSPNHTKISICISRENAGDSHNKFSSYIFDHIRPSLSTCLTDLSRMKDETSKSSQSMNRESDDDEDDFKSVGSTLGNSDSEEEKSEPKRQETVAPTPQKNFSKHRFDFYRKMNLDSNLNKCKHHSVSNSVCRYKELEPLKQALTEMQIRMRSIKRDAIINSNDYYERALKLAKMSAGFCQSCGNRAVIPNDTFGYYRTLLPRKSTNSRRTRNYTTTMTRSPSYYSVRSSNAELNNPFYDLGIKHSSYSLHPTIHSNRTIVRSSLHDMPVLFEGI